MRYQHDDARVVVTNERGFSTAYLYLVLGAEYTDMMPVSISEPENVGTLISRNVFGDVTRVFQGERLPDDSIRGFGKTYRYDSARRLVESYEREVGTTVYGHDAVGNVISERVNNLPATTFTYDGLNRRTRVDFADTTPDVVTEYDANGNVTRVTKGVTEWFYVYDENDNLESERLTIDHFLLGPRVYQFLNDYSELDVLASIIYPSGLAVDYAPDAFGRATRAGSFASNITYHSSGQLASYQLANGVTTNIALNQRLLPRSITVPGVVSLTYGYDAGGNVLSIADGIDSTKNVTIPGSTTGYDGLDRLRRATGSWGTARFTYDFNGNIIVKEVGSRGMKFTLDANGRVGHIGRYASGSPNTPTGYLRFEFDSRGNTIARRNRDSTSSTQPIDEKLFDYDTASQLVRARVNSVTADGVTVVAYKDYMYDANGQRVVEKKHASYDIRFSVYAKGQLLFEDDVAQCTRTDHIRLGAMAIARSDDQSAPPSLDTDGDQIADCIETQLGLDPNDAADALLDADGDGLTNLQEYRGGTSLTRADTDNDGLSDHEELERELTDPTIADTDGDGLPDGYEAAHPGLDPRSADTDHDGVSDHWEVRLQTDPTDPADGLLDSDSDGFSNRQESGADADPQFAGLAPPRGTASWSVTMDGQIDDAPVIGRDRTIHIKTSRGRVQAFYPDGTRRWEFAPLSSSVSNPVVGPDGTVYVATVFTGGIQEGAPRSFLYALNPDGSQQWVWSTPYYLNTAVTIGENGRLYFAGYDAAGLTRYLLMSLSSLGTEPVSRMIQSTALAPVTVDLNGNVIVCSGFGIEVFSKTLEPRWAYSMRGSANVAPSVGKDGTIFVGDKSGYLYALTAAGQLRWERTIGTNLRSSAVIGADDSVYVGTYQGALLALNAADGTERWSLPTTGTTYTPAAAADGTIYVTSYAGDLIAASSSGSLLWKYATGSRLNSAPVIDRDGTVYFAATAGHLYAVADNGGGPARSAWPMYRHDSASTSYICFNEPAFSILADTDGDRIDDCSELRYGLDPYSPSDGNEDSDGDGLRNYQEHRLGTRLDLADTDSDGLSDGLEVLTYHTNPLHLDTDHDTISDGDEIRMAANPLDASEAMADFDGDGFSNRQEILTNTDPFDSSSRPTEGQLMRNVPGASHVAVSTDGTIYQANGSGSSLEALYPDFTLKWTVPVSIHAGPVVGADGSIYVVEKHRQRVLAYWPNGLLRWAISKPASSSTGFSEHIAIGSDGRIFVGYSTNHWEGDYVLAFGMDGTPATNWPQSGVRYFGRSGTLSIAPNGDLAIYDGFNSLTLYSATGSYLWRNDDQDIGRGLTGNTVFGADGTLYLGNVYGLHAIDPATATRRWRKIGTSGPPLIDAGGNVLVFCSPNPRMICAVDANGNTVWTESTGYSFLETPVLVSGGALVSTNSHLVGFDSSGALRWQTELAQGSWPSYSPVVLDDGTIYAPGYQQGIVVVGRGGLANSTWPAPDRDNRGTRNAGQVMTVASSPAPSVILIDPVDSPISIDIGQNRTVRAMATDLKDGDIRAAIRWSSSIDGEFATGPTVSLLHLSAGTHTITAAVTDSDGLSGSASFELIKTAVPLVLNINSPSGAPGLDVGQSISFGAYAADPGLPALTMIAPSRVPPHPRPPRLPERMALIAALPSGFRSIAEGAVR